MFLDNTGDTAGGETMYQVLAVHANVVSSINSLLISFARHGIC